ncbi:MAG: STAS domain-containing protein [Thermoanaerobaculia bacterium]
MKATSRTVNGVEIISLQGKITIGSGDSQLREVITNALNSGKNNLLLDMSGVTTIDSSGIGELVGSYTTATNRGGKLKLLHLPAKLNELLHVTQLITVFEVYENEGEAVKSY